MNLSPRSPKPLRASPAHIAVFALFRFMPVAAHALAAGGSLDGNWLDFGPDPREVDSRWLDEALDGVPLRVNRIELSNNAAQSVMV